MINLGTYQGRIIDRRESANKENIYLRVAIDYGPEAAADFFLSKALALKCPPLGEQCTVTYSLKLRAIAKNNARGAYGAFATEISVIDIMPAAAPKTSRDRVA